MKLRTLNAALFLLPLILFTPAIVHSLPIDDFGSAHMITITDPAPLTASSGLDNIGPVPIGGKRKLYMEKLNTSVLLGGADWGVITSPYSRISLDSDAGFAAQCHAIWDGSTTFPATNDPNYPITVSPGLQGTGPTVGPNGGFNLKPNGSEDRFRMLIYFDQGDNDPVTIQIKAYSKVYPGHLFGTLTLTQSTDKQFKYFEFQFATLTKVGIPATVNGNPVNNADIMKDIRALQLTVVGSPSTDITIKCFETSNGTGGICFPDPTPTPTPTVTPTVPTNTPTATYTPTIPTNTPTRTYTPTVPTNTPTRTYTPTVPTNTPTHTYTPTVPTNTPTHTYTPTVPTNTPTRTYTPTVPTNTPTRTYTPTVPTSTPTRTYTPTNTSTPGVCVPGETRSGGCYTPTPTNTFTPTATITQTFTPGICLPGAIPGDVTLDCCVDAKDQAAWIRGFGIAVGAVIGQGDADQDGDVDGADRLMIDRNFGNCATPTPTVTATNTPTNNPSLSPTVAPTVTFGQCTFDNTERRQSLDHNAKRQEKIIMDGVKSLKKSLKGKTGPEVDKLIAKSTKLLSKARLTQIENWKISWVGPRIDNTCPDNANVCATFSFETLIQDYKNNAGTLRKLVNDVIKLRKAARKIFGSAVGGGTGADKKLIKRGDAELKTATDLADTVPKSVKVCG